MLKSNSLLWRFSTIQSLFNSSECKNYICTTSFLNRWYVHFLRTPRVYTPPKTPITFDKDWENEPYQPKAKNEYISSIKSLEDFQRLDERCKAMFTYAFVPKKQEYEENVIKTLESLGFKPTDDCLAAKIVRMTLELRYKKWRLKEQPRCVTLRLATRCLLNARKRDLRLLRATNLPEFHRITSALKITGYEHVDPYRLPTNDPVVQRKISFRHECYQKRLTKLAVLKAKLLSSESEFYNRKNKTLTNLLNDLSMLVVEDANNPENKTIEAKNLMKQLFNEIVEERKLETLQAPMEDQLTWYAKEAVKREQYHAKQAQKLEKQQRKMRK
ncbi:unnamed protein product [Schistosoma turkestanicum]|nr:unnamed protein product [Schistosoma turkestanicum]